MSEKFNVTYSCGCVHEIEQDGASFRPTGKNKDCGKVHDFPKSSLQTRGKK